MGSVNTGQIKNYGNELNDISNNLKEILFNMYSSASGYLNDTFLNSTVPTSFVLNAFKLPFIILELVSRTSLIRDAETDALGIIINIIASIKNDIITCIA